MLVVAVGEVSVAASDGAIATVAAQDAAVRPMQTGHALRGEVLLLLAVSALLARLGLLRAVSALLAITAGHLAALGGPPRPHAAAAIACVALLAAAHAAARPALGIAATAAAPGSCACGLLLRLLGGC